MTTRGVIVAHNFPVNLVDVVLCRSQLFQQPHFLLLQGILGAFGILVDYVFDLIMHVALIHSIDNIFSIGVKLGREYL